MSGNTSPVDKLRLQHEVGAGEHHESVQGGLVGKKQLDVVDHPLSKGATSSSCPYKDAASSKGLPVALFTVTPSLGRASLGDASDVGEDPKPCTRGEPLPGSPMCFFGGEGTSSSISSRVLRTPKNDEPLVPDSWLMARCKADAVSETCRAETLGVGKGGESFQPKPPSGINGKIL